MTNKVILTAAACLLSLGACQPPAENNTTATPTTPTKSATPGADSGNLSLWPALQPAIAQDPAQDQQIEQLLQSMTAAQKVAQIIQPDIRWMTVEDMRQYGFGSFLNGGGAFPNDNKAASAADWLALAEKMQVAALDTSLDGLAIPTIWGTDAVHGHNNVRGATIFPHNIGLGATRNAKLVEAIGHATAKEVAATGIHWIFAPTVAVARDDRWGRSYESYSEQPELVAELGAALVKGIQGQPGSQFLQGAHRIATAKHYLADGGTTGGRDQGNAELTEQQLIALHAQGYFSSLNAGVQTVMASFSSVNGSKMHGNQYLLTEVLKQKLGFDGIVVGDWNGHGQLPGCSNQSCAAAINAGVDIIMVPEDWRAMYQNTLAQVSAGEISSARLDDAVRRILRVKHRAGLFQQPLPSAVPGAGQQQLIGAPEHLALAEQAVRESLVLLKNNQQLLPLAPKQRVLVAGDGADSIPKQSGGWSVTWQGTGTTNQDFPQGKTIYAGIAAQVTAAGGSVELSADGSFSQQPDVAIVVIGENPYAEFDGDTPTLDYQAGVNRDEALLKQLKAQGIPVVTVFLSGRPLWVNPELNASDAFIAAWLPGTAGYAIADLLFRDSEGQIRHDFSGKLAFSWPANAESQPLNTGDADYQPLFAFGYGLSVHQLSELPQLSEQVAETQKATTQLSLFERRAQQGLSLQLRQGNEVVTVAGNKAATSDRSLQLTAVNWQKQEDALQLSFNSNNAAQLVLQASEALDLSSYGQLVFDLKWNQAPTADVMLGMSCGSGCGGQLPLGDLLQQKVSGQWHKLTIELACFANAGAALNHLYQPFNLQSAAPWQVSLANIRVTPATAAADLSCTK